MFSIAHFAPISWDELQKNGYRKTSGAMLKALWSHPDVKRVWYIQHERRWGAGIRIEPIDNKLTVIGLPIGLPYERFNPVRNFNTRLQAWLLRQRVLTQTDRQDLVYWFYDWWNIELISLLPRVTTVMEVTDVAGQFISQEIGQQKRLNHVKRLSCELVDCFFPVSDDLASECVGANGTVTPLSNGIGRDFLEQARRPQREPEPLREVPHPRLCIVGTGWSFNYRLDHELLAKSLQILGDWQFILIGCEKIESPALKALGGHPRVKMVGLVPLENLTAYIQYCDVCSVPYRQEVENSGDRLKIYEYLACRKSIILSVHEGLEVLRPFLRYAFNADEFSQACQEAARQPFSHSQQLSLDALLDQMSWDKRGQTCLAIIAETKQCFS